MIKGYKIYWKEITKAYDGYIMEDSEVEMETYIPKENHAFKAGNSVITQDDWTFEDIFMFYNKEYIIYVETIYE